MEFKFKFKFKILTYGIWNPRKFEFQLKFQFCPAKMMKSIDDVINSDGFHVEKQWQIDFHG